MPAVASEVSVGTAVATISGPSIGKRYVYVQNSDYDGSTEVYCGDAAVGTASGVRVWRDTNTVFELYGPSRDVVVIHQAPFKVAEKCLG